MKGRADSIDRKDGDGNRDSVLSRPQDQRVEDLIDKCLATTPPGARIDVDEFLRAELPYDADQEEHAELRRRLIALQSLRDAARAKANGRVAHSESGPERHVSTNGESGELPRAIGRYRILDVLAPGHASIVYRAFDPKSDRQVALKVTRTDHALSDEELARWKRDARVVAQLRHPNIVPYHEVGEADDAAYIDMELIQGASLEDKLRSAPGGRIQPCETARIVRKIADALHHAHDRQIVHRDVKPANILIDEKGEPQLADFGLARRLNREASLTQAGQVLGTPAYLSPEQARGESHNVTAKADIFSLGVVMYRMLTGTLPFDDEDGGEYELLARIIHAPPTPPSKILPSIPRDLELICLKALEKEPRDRFGSAAVMADDLGRWLDDVPIRCRQVSRWCRKNPVIASLAAAFVLSLVIGIAAT